MKGHIIVEPVKHNGKILNFSNSSIIKNVVVDAQPLPEKYINVDVEITMLENKKYHIILSDKEGIPINRRNEFRVYVGSYVTAQLANINQSIEAILKGCQCRWVLFGYTKRRHRRHCRLRWARR